MSQYIISPEGNLFGTVSISGSKNAALPILAAGLLSEGESVFSHIPELSDTACMGELLLCMGANYARHMDGTVTVSFPSGGRRKTAPLELVNNHRASFLIMGPLLARCGRVRLPLPGGCQIGARPIDLHLKGFSVMGAKIRQGHGYVEASCDRLKGGSIYLDFPSVGATENLILAAQGVALHVNQIGLAALSLTAVILWFLLGTFGTKIAMKYARYINFIGGLAIFILGLQSMLQALPGILAFFH